MGRALKCNRKGEVNAVVGLKTIQQYVGAICALWEHLKQEGLLDPATFTHPNGTLMKALIGTFKLETHQR